MGDICHKVDGKLVHANSLFAALDGRGGGGDVGKTQISIEIQRAIPRKSPTSATAPSWIKEVSTIFQEATRGAEYETKTFKILRSEGSKRHSGGGDGGGQSSYMENVQQQSLGLLAALKRHLHESKAPATPTPKAAETDEKQSLKKEEVAMLAHELSSQLGQCVQACKGLKQLLAHLTLLKEKERSTVDESQTSASCSNYCIDS